MKRRFLSSQPSATSLPGSITKDWCRPVAFSRSVHSRVSAARFVEETLTRPISLEYVAQTLSRAHSRVLVTCAEVQRERSQRDHYHPLNARPNGVPTLPKRSLTLLEAQRLPARARPISHVKRTPAIVAYKTPRPAFQSPAR